MSLKKLLSIVMGFCFLFDVFGTFGENELEGIENGESIDFIEKNVPKIVEDEDGEPIGLILNLPEGLVKDCEDPYWKLSGEDEKLKGDLDNILRSPESFEKWCQTQTKLDNKNPVAFRGFLKMYAYLLKGANENNYKLEGDFCKRVGLGSVLGSIHLKGFIRCGDCCHTKEEKYIKNLKLILLDSM